MRLTALSASVLALFFAGLVPVPQVLAASTGSASTPVLYPVHISITPQNITQVTSYDLVAYNSSGVQVASYTGLYPEAALSLPAGTYLFAATVEGQQSSKSSVCCGCLQTAPAQSSSASSAIAYPCYYNPQPQEYGYSVTAVSAPTTVSISTESPSSFPTARVSVNVSYKNGTAVSGAYVSANSVGTYLYWGNYANFTLYAQTGKDGAAQMVVPAVPLVVSASYSVQVSLPKGQTTEQVTVGGEVVNVTLYYSPQYVYLTDSALLLPPQTSLSMVLTAQTQSGPILYAQSSGAETAVPPTTGAAVSSPGSTSAATTTTLSASSTNIPPFQASLSPTPSSGSPATSSGASFVEVGTLALAAALAAVVGVGISKARR